MAEGRLSFSGRKRPSAELGDASPMPSPPAKVPRTRGRALQVVELNMAEKYVSVNKANLAELESRLQRLGTKKVAVVAVMGAFRTGKSLLLNLFLRFLRHQAEHGEDAAAADASLPAWVLSDGEALEGGATGAADGFRFCGGMDTCTEGIWMWSEPFVVSVKNEEVALLLMDTEGAWDSNLTKEQSATIFGLAAALSSTLVYNVSMQIQEDKVENLTYFMRFAQAALRRAALETGRREEVEQPFQGLDFLVRDWRHFGEGWGLQRCEEQMREHFSKHLDAENLRERETAEALQSMFRRVGCFCLPHPGFAVERDSWALGEVRQGFWPLLDAYFRRLLAELEPKQVLGKELSTTTFPLTLQSFVSAFRHAVPAARSFTEAMTSVSLLVAKEEAMSSYGRYMAAAAKRQPSGMEPQEFEALHRSAVLEVQDDFQRSVLFGSEEDRAEAWSAVQTGLKSLCERLREENTRKLDAALNSLAPMILVALVLFFMDWSTDYTCDWWSQNCTDFSRLCAIGYGCLFLVVAWRLLLAHNRQRLSASASAELWKELLKLASACYSMASAAGLLNIASQAWHLLTVGKSSS